MTEHIEKILSVAAWYKQKSSFDNNDIETLIHAGRSIAASMVFLSMDVGIAYEHKNNAEYLRKKTQADVLHRIKTETLARGEKVVISAVEADMERECMYLVKKELDTDATWQKMKLIAQTASSLLDQIRQHIAYLKKEKENEYTITRTQ